MVGKVPAYLHVCDHQGECIRVATVHLQGSVIEINSWDVADLTEKLQAAIDELGDEAPGVYHRPSTESV